MERPTARNLPAHRPQRKHGEPPNSHMELGRRGGGAGRLFIRYFGASGPLIRRTYIMVPPLARSRWQSLGAIARCLGREGLVDELAFALDLKGGSPTIWLEIDVSVRKRVLETHGPKTNHPKVSQNSRTRQKNPFKEPWHIVLSALCSPSNLFRDLGFRSGSIFCTVLRHGFPLCSPPLSSSIA